jgi:hypothetical protein
MLKHSRNFKIHQVGLRADHAGLKSRQAEYDDATVFPTGFDPQACGMRKP